MKMLSEVCIEIKELIVTVLNLQGVSANDIQDEASFLKVV